MEKRDYFDVLGVARAYHLDASDLEKRYLALSQALHPDKHARSSPTERLQSLEQTTALNDAYRTLKSDSRRAHYLLGLEGVDISDDKSPSRVSVDQGLLLDILELREALEEARASQNEKQIKMLTADVDGRRERALLRVDSGFFSYEKGDRSSLRSVAESLIELRYYDRFLDAVTEHEIAKEELV